MHAGCIVVNFVLRSAGLHFPFQNMTLGVKTSTSVTVHGTYNVLGYTKTGNDTSIIVVGGWSTQTQLDSRLPFPFPIYSDGFPFGFSPSRTWNQ